MDKKIFLLLILLQAICGCLSSTEKGSSVYVINKSSSEVSSGLLDIGGDKFKINRLKSNEEVSFKFTPYSDCHYTIKINFLSGNKLEKETGYITSGFDIRDKLILLDNDIILEREILDPKKNIKK